LCIVHHFLSDNPLMSVAEHRSHAPLAVRCAVVTVSDTRTESTDTSGRAIAQLLTEHGHAVVCRTIVPDERGRIAAVLDEMLAREDVDVVLCTGGTGITARDGTYEVVSTVIEKQLDGFGELFRMLSYGDVGPAAMLSRACAGLARGRIVVAMPGAEAAVRLAMHKLLLPELGHMVREARR
jgi:molybdenum cofactor biosynthesis protein B